MEKKKIEVRLSVWRNDWAEVKAEATRRGITAEELATELLNYAVMECIVKARRELK